MSFQGQEVLSSCLVTLPLSSAQRGHVSFSVCRGCSPGEDEGAHTLLARAGMAQDPPQSPVAERMVSAWLLRKKAHSSPPDAGLDPLCPSEWREHSQEGHLPFWVTSEDELNV